ncbi:MAG TPA: hypothetical protein VK745_09555 [Polyangiaceae bacterium]|jgi:hypothetical protein|nr:hypothetical protein [Polyangiaceae bacterium]
MTLSITPKQALFLWHLILTDGASDVGVMSSNTVPRLSRTEWQALVDAGYLDSPKRGRATFLTATDRTWSWAEQAEQVELAKFDSAAGAAALEALLNRLLPLLRERGIGLAELFENDPPPAPPSPRAPRAPRKRSASRAAPQKKAKAKKAPAKKKSKTKKPKTKKAKPEKARKAPKAKPTKENRQSATRSPREPLTPPPSLPERIEQACLKLTRGARQTRVTLRDLRAHLWDVARDDLDRELLALQRDKKLVLYREDNSAALRPEDHQAALLVGNEPRHLVLLEA